jgi:hypothetical protein
MVRWAVAVAVSTMLVVAPAASAQVTTDVIGEAAQSLRSDPVFVHPDAEASVDEEALRERVQRGDAGDVFVAVLPESAGPPGPAAQQLFNELRGNGTYAVISGRSFSAGNPRVSVRDLATEAVQARRGEGATAIVTDFVDRVADRRAQGGGGSRPVEPAGTSGGGGASGGFMLGLLALLGLGGLAASIASRRRRRREEQAQLAEVKTVARDDLVALGDDIRALDLDVEMPDADPEAKRYYGQAVEAYSRAENKFNLARRPGDLEPVTRDLEEGRFAMTAAKARLEGRPVPERTVPCFFDPRHGPSTAQVEWAPEGGQPRPVPVCAADAQRISDGYDPLTREIDVGGERMPYWNAPAYYGPWSGGFFGGFGGGGFLPGMLIGSMMGGGFGFGGHDHYGGDGDFGGGDFGGGGDCGAGGGDFGGGDFGGGDFGGGDF